MKQISKFIIIFCAFVIVCACIAGFEENKKEIVGPEHGSTDTFLMCTDFVSKKSDDTILRDIETFDVERVSQIYIYIPEDTGYGMSLSITRADHPEEMQEILSSVYGGKMKYQKVPNSLRITERIVFDYNWYFLLYGDEMEQLALVFQYSDDTLVYNGHVFQASKIYDPYVRPCILKLKEEKQEKLKTGELTQRRIPIP